MQDGKVEPEMFTERLQRELQSSPQPYLVPFLKVIYCLSHPHTDKHMSVVFSLVLCFLKHATFVYLVVLSELTLKWAHGSVLRGKGGLCDVDLITHQVPVGQ